MYGLNMHVIERLVEAADSPPPVLRPAGGRVAGGPGAAAPGASGTGAAAATAPASQLQLLPAPCSQRGRPVDDVLLRDALEGEEVEGVPDPVVVEEIDCDRVGRPVSADKERSPELPSMYLEPGYDLVRNRWPGALPLANGKAR